MARDGSSSGSSGEHPWYEWKLGGDAFWRPICSEQGCANVATRIIGRYENTGVHQGEYSKFGGWVACETHADPLWKRLSGLEGGGDGA